MKTIQWKISSPSHRHDTLGILVFGESKIGGTWGNGCEVVGCKLGSFGWVPESKADCYGDGSKSLADYAREVCREHFVSMTEEP